MGREQGPEFYNARLERVSLPLGRSPWLKLYCAAADLLGAGREAALDARIADVGCGTGRFAGLLRDRGYRHYWGFDFADRRIAEARRCVPEFTFDVADVRDPATLAGLADFDVLVMLEVLEHLADDLALVAAARPGARLVLSVPNYDSKGHVRTFADFHAMLHRYGGLLQFDQAEHRILPGARPNRHIIVAAATRRDA